MSVRLNAKVKIYSLSEYTQFIIVLKASITRMHMPKDERP